jgi:ubiquinol-cytochrome c reductase cytochrome c subunit
MRAVVIATLAATLLTSAASAATPRQGVTPAAGGKALYAANCSRCHGSDGRGIAKQGPSLRDAGALATDFYVRTGYMPLDDPRAQPARSVVLFSEREIRALVAFVATLGHGPRIPSPQWRTASVSSGMKLYTDHCAGCHQIVGQGGYVTGARVPPLGQATPRQIAEAVRIGPYLMPRFSPEAITPAQLNDVVAYVEYAKHPQDPGGWSIGHLGPWPEGMVTWFLGASVLVAMCLLFARRTRS